MHRIRDIGASLGDSGTAAAGSFLVGILALRVLDTYELALYALLFSAGAAAMAIPQQMAYLPRRIRLNQVLTPVSARYSSDLWGSAPYTIVAAVIVAVAGFPLYHAVSAPVAWAMAMSAMLWVISTAFQDHLRTALHISQEHGHAAATSTMRLVVVGAGISVFLIGDGHFPSEVVSASPFAVLAAANIVSAGFGMWRHRGAAKIDPIGAVPFAVSLRTATSGLLLQSGGYVTNIIVIALLGASAVAELEAARVAAQPVFVAGAALAAYFVPPAIRAQQAGDMKSALRGLRSMVIIQSVLGVVYAALVLLLVSPLSAIAGRSIDGLLAGAQSVAFSSQSAIGALNQLNIAAGRYRMATASTVLSLVVSFASLALLAAVMGIYAVPASMVLGAIARASTLLIGGRRAR